MRSWPTAGPSRKPKRKITTRKKITKKEIKKAWSDIEQGMALSRTKPKPAPKEEFEDFRVRMLLLALQEPPEPAPPPLPLSAPVTASNTVKSVTLYYTKHSENSDKVYTLDIEKEPKYKDAYYVNFGYGKRGKTLKTGRKTKIAVSLLEAQRIYATFYNEKKAEGYTENISGVPFSS